VDEEEKKIAAATTDEREEEECEMDRTGGMDLFGREE
jgi:hypothetical protein